MSVIDRRRGAAVVAVAGAVLTVAATGAVSGSTAAAAPQPTAQGYTQGSQSAAQDAAQRRQLATALRNQRAGTPTALYASTIYYDASRATQYRSYISQAAQIWNSRVTTVKLVAATGGQRATLVYLQGSYGQQGSHYQGNSHGSGTISIDYQQTQQYSPLRVVAHETGHALGLPDHYSGPCSELMSGGGAGPSCTNPNPNSQEVSRVNSIWRYGVAPGTSNRAAFTQLAGR